MNHEQLYQLGFRKPLFKEAVVIRALNTLRELNDELLGLLDAQNPSPLGTFGTKVIKNLVDLKINEITDELTLERLIR